MDQEIIPRQASATSSSHSMGMVHSLMSAAGVALLTVTKLGASFAATIWAVTKVLGLPDFVMYALMVLSLVPVIWATLWVAGRA